MSTPRRVCAVIPARRGSKRLPLKNLLRLGGVPLVVHSIRAALAASLVDDVIVSTEDPEIAAVASDAGAAVVMRPPELATDTVQNNGVARHALASLGIDDGVLVLLQPTSPLRSAEDIDACVRPVRDGQAASSLTVIPVEHHPGKAVVIEDGLVEPFTNDADMEARRQTMRDVYRQNGAVYAVDVRAFLERGRFYIRPCAAVIVSPDRSVDIDTERDLAFAEFLLQRRSGNV